MGWRIRIRDNEGCDDPVPFLSPDLVVQNYLGAEIRFDHELAEDDETRNKQGLRSKEGLHTAIIIQLFTDRRILDDQVHPDPRSQDPRGWWGDSVDIETEYNETELGSHLWLLRRSILNNEVVETAKGYVEEALQPILDQGAVASFHIEAEAQSMAQGGQPSTGVLAIAVDGYSQDGLKVYSQRFDVLWDQIRALAA